jgi:hypothetical protein
MKKFRNTIASLTVAVLMTGLALNFNACTEQSPLSSDQTDSSTVTLSKGKPAGGGEVNYPISGSKVYQFWSAHKLYRGGTLNMADGSFFQLVKDALTPPPTISWGEDVTITMMTERDTVRNELIFTFGPSGSQFQPSAKVYLNYKILGIEIPKFYYIDENGNYIEQTPDEINVTNRSIILYVDHFSRYAIGGGE